MGRVSAIPETGQTLTAAPRFRRRPVGLWLDVMAEWIERARQRRQLGRLDDRMLKDIGLSRADVDAETRKPFWQF